MELQKIKAIIELIEASSLSEFKLKEGDEELYLKKGQIQASAAPVAAGPPFEAKEVPAQPEEDSFILSPMVGIFYASPAPDAPPFVRPGQTVKAGQVVCIIEAMKLMNELECEYDGEVIDCLVANNERVDYGQPLFKIKKWSR